MKPWPGTNVACIQEFPGGIEVPTLKCFEAVFSRILSIIVYLSVFALFVMLVIGGFKYLTSGGDQKQTAAAQQTLTFAIAGIALMAIAFLIFRIIEAFTGVPITIFKIPDGN